MLIDAMMAVFVLTLGAAAFFSLLPMLDRSQYMAREQSTALQMSNEMVDQLQLLKPSNITVGTLTQLNLIDAGQTGSPYKFSHVPLEESTGYSPAQALKNGVGTMTVTSTDAGSVMVRLTITWDSASGKQGSLSTGTIIGGYR